MRKWEAFLTDLEGELGKGTVEKWLRPLELLRFDAGNLYLEAADSFQALWFEEHIRKRAEKYLQGGSHRKVRIHLTTAKGSAPTEQQERPRAEGPFALTFDELDPCARLDSFISTEENALPYQVLRDLCTGETGEVELGTFNPLYLYGPAGSGKTHLLMGVTAALQKRGLKALYVRCERFTEHVISAIRAGEMGEFRKRYRGVDALLIDDIQFLSKKGATQEELFHTFNALHVERRQIILAANSAPGELRAVEERLVSRFEWGLVLSMEPTPRASFEEILTQRAEAIGFPLSPKVKSYLLESFPQGPSQLLQALEALSLRAHMNEKASDRKLIGLSSAQALLSDLVEEQKKGAVTPERIIGSVASHYGVTVEAIMGKSQKKEHSLPRQLAMYLCRKQLALPYTGIGETFGRDHSTVISSVRRIEKEVRRSGSDLQSIASVIARDL